MSPVAFERTREYVWLCTFKMWFNRWVFLGFWRHAHLSSFGEFQALLCRYKPDLVFSFKMRKSSTSWFFLISLGFSSIWLNNFNDFWNYTATGWAFLVVWKVVKDIITQVSGNIWYFMRENANIWYIWWFHFICVKTEANVCIWGE